MRPLRMAAVLAAVAIACASSGGSIGGSSRTVRGVTVTFRVDPAAIQSGRSVRLAITLFNSAGIEEKLTFASGQKYDLVARRDGRTVWRWSDGRFFTQAVTTETIPSQASVQFSETWLPEGPGSYELEAIVLAESFDTPMTGRLEVLP